MSAIAILLSSRQRAMENTGKLPFNNIISTALAQEIFEETNTKWIAEPGEGFICGMHVRVVKSQHLFAVSFDTDSGPDV